jgi:diacylglycerol kinase
MKHTSINSLKRSKRILSFKYAIKGIRKSILTQPNLRIHLMATFLVSFLGFYLKISDLEWVAILITCGMVIAAEMMNTAVEALTDLISPDYHKKAGYVKDASAGAVLILAIASSIIGSMIFIPKIMDLMGISF